MKTNFLKLCTAIALIMSLGVLSLNAQAPKSTSPFLIQDKLPHFTKLVKQNWDNKDLNLIGNQKKELLEVRKRTMTSIKDLSPRIKKLEEETVLFILQGESLNDIFQMVEELSKLKAEATRTHIMCLRDTKNILTKEQLDFLTQTP